MSSSEVIVVGQFDDADDTDTATSSEDEGIGETEEQKDLADYLSRLQNVEETCSFPDANDSYISSDNDDDELSRYYDDEPKEGYNAQQIGSKTASFQPANKVFGQKSCKINLGDIHSSERSNGDKPRRKDKSSRATILKVLDERTLVILSKMIGQGVFDNITGSISVGKEANVFRAEKNSEDGPTKYLAVKVYKTSIMTFKNRSKYVEGDFRYRGAYAGSNPRKMIKIWAEKEIRNLTRIHQAGIPCPEPILVKGNMCLMSFIGTDDGAAAPLLHSANLPDEIWHELYLDIVQYMRVMYHECKLIHADLSEFNILYHDGKAYIIDVSQAVEHGHPNAMVFLRKDCTNITTFFQSKGVATMLVKELFDFITDMTIEERNINTVLQAAMDTACARSHNGMTEQEKIDEEVFKNAFIPRTLNQVRDHEREWLDKQRGEAVNSHYHTVTGLKTDLSGAQEIPRLLEDRLRIDPSLAEQIEDSDEDTEEDEEENSETVEKKRVCNKRPKNETKEEKKERKREVKEARKEKILTKVKKHEKKRAVKQHQTNSKSKK